MSSVSGIVVGMLLLFGVLYTTKIIHGVSKGKLIFTLIYPSITMIIAVYYLIKSIYIHNPHPNMENGIYMLLFGAISIWGYLVYFVTFLINKIRIK